MKRATRIKRARASIERRSVPEEWWAGGNLHQGTIKDWKAATYANKLASAYDFLFEVDEMGRLAPEVSAEFNTDMEHGRPYAEELVTGLDRVVACGLRVPETESIAKAAGMVLTITERMTWPD